MKYNREIWPFLSASQQSHTAAHPPSVVEMLTQQFVELPLGHGLESFVCGSEHREGSRPVEVLCQPCRLDCSHQGTAKQTCIKCFTAKHFTAQLCAGLKGELGRYNVKPCWGAANQIAKMVLREEMSCGVQPEHLRRAKQPGSADSMGTRWYGEPERSAYSGSDGQGWLQSQILVVLREPLTLGSQLTEGYLKFHSL